MLLLLCKKVWGPQHPNVASSNSNLPAVLGDQGKLKKAKEYHERALAIMHETLGPQHADVAQSYNSYARVICDEGNLEKA